MKHLDVFLIFLFVRLASIYLVQTFFVPDEYWQSLEVAHNLGFGYGYLSWEWTKGIRSYLPPLFIAAFYKILEAVQLDTAELLVSPLMFYLTDKCYIRLQLRFCTQLLRSANIKAFFLLNISHSLFYLVPNNI